MVWSARDGVGEGSYGVSAARGRSSSVKVVE